MNHLGKGSRGDTSYSAHQCARLYEDPRETYTGAVEQIVHHFTATKDKENILDPKADQSFSVYADADYSGKKDSHA
eukprot:3428305-Ditylum_brightwellii.AAC.1